MNNSTSHDSDKQDPTRAPDQHADESGDENNAAPATPFEPDSDDETPLGDTDEHSDA
jgi:hypothetical protein